MNCFTHMAGGALCGVILATTDQQVSAPLLAGLSVFGSLLPDIDIGTSKIAGLCKPAAYIAQFVFGHRGVFHSPLLWAVVGWLAAGRLPAYVPYILAIGIGVASHLLLDMLNSSGIPLFWPFPARISIAKIRTGGLFDFLIGLTIFGITCFFLFTVEPFVSVISHYLKDFH